MALAPGTRLGPYEITGELGVGGMGEVYRATDTNLGRDVAIKILPPVFASDAERIARFQREAEALAALSHPNIAHIYGLERGAEMTALAMELVQGPTLEERIAEGPIPVHEALAIARQIADALEAAHARHIVHRDLKPANIKLKPDGTVKVLDFGIATAPESAGVTSGQASPTPPTPALTEAGVRLGTAAYMSPEQARGRSVDQRADIWAFGCVLYEMLTAQPAFGGDDVTTTLARVLEREVDVGSLPTMITPDVRQAIKLCLQKDVTKRLADIRDVKLALDGAFERGAQGVADGEAVVGLLSRRDLAVAASFILGGVATGLTTWRVTRPGLSAVDRFDVTPDDLTVFHAVPSAAISPDGQLIAYVAGNASELRLHRLDQDDPRGSTTLTNEGLEGTPFFSPDSAQIAFFAGSGLKRVSIRGGPVTTITDEIPAPERGASWGLDGAIIYGTVDPNSGLSRVRAAGGRAEPLTKPDPSSGTVGHWWPEVLPGGEAVLFTLVGASEQDSKIAVLSLVTNEQRVLVPDGIFPHYSATGHLLFGRAGTLFAVGFDAARLQIHGEPVPVQEGVLTRGATGAAEASLASNGTLLYLSGAGTAESNRHLVWVDGETGKETVVQTPPRAYDQVVLAPDGRHAALGIAGDERIWIADLDRGSLIPLPADLGDQEPSLLFFSDDGQRIASSAIRDGRQAVVWQAIDGTGEAEPLATFDESVKKVPSAALSPDGTRFVPTVIREDADLGIVTMGEPESLQNFRATSAAEYGAAISPDGHWIAYVSDKAGIAQVYVERFPERGGRVAASIGSGRYPHWLEDRSALTYFELDSDSPNIGIRRVPVMWPEDPEGLPTFGAPTELFAWKYVFAGDPQSRFDMTPDGRRFLLITVGEEDFERPRLILVQNWTQKLKRLVPPK